MTLPRFDLAVIGAGSAGFSAAITAAEQGAQVALIGEGTIGGTCVNVGCVPSKAMIRAVEPIHQANRAGRFDGISAAAQIDNWQALVAQKNALVEELRQAKYTDMLAAYDSIAYVEGRARLAEGGVAVAGRLLTAAKVVIATGTRPKLPDVPGLGGTPYLTSTSALDLAAAPRSLLVMGGGYVGLEFAQMFARAGSRVSVVCRSHLLPGAEPEVRGALRGYLEDEGVSIFEGLAYDHLRATDAGVELAMRGGDGPGVLKAEQLLLATGRTANTDGLGLAEAGVALGPSGGVRVDDRMRTTVPGVYAAGDVTGSDQFVYMAAYGGRIAAENALNGDARQYDNAAMPWVVFTDPQVAGVGLSEAAARARGLHVRTTVLGLDQVPRALCARDTRGLIKLVAEVGTDLIVGAQILAPEGADSIQTAVLAIKHRLTVGDLASTIFPYLTTVEGLKLAAQSFDKDVTKLSCCAG